MTIGVSSMILPFFSARRELAYGVDGGAPVAHDQGFGNPRPNKGSAIYSFVFYSDSNGPLARTGRPEFFHRARQTRASVQVGIGGEAERALNQSLVRSAWEPPRRPSPFRIFMTPIFLPHFRAELRAPKLECFPAPAHPRPPLVG